MKSPAQLKARLRRQWESANTRESRLLRPAESWPVILSIGKPIPRDMQDDLDAVKRHVDMWRSVGIGEVVWESVKYRATADPVKLPTQWIIGRPTQWIDAAADRNVSGEFDFLSELVAGCDKLFHSILTRRRSLWRDKSTAEVCQAARLAKVLKPGIANGQPLRTMSLEGIDTKFFERNSRLVTALLDVRFDNEVSKIGLESFLGAFIESSHWLLVLDLDGSLLPFSKQRVASTDLSRVNLPGERILIVENESCQHQLPTLKKTIAVLGAGFDLVWTKAANFEAKSVAYWGDIDTWGLQFLGKARENIPNLTALLMSSEVFDAHEERAVIEPVVAGTKCPPGLSDLEVRLYKRLLDESRGRLEQEFLPETIVNKALVDWATN